MASAKENMISLEVAIESTLPKLGEEIYYNDCKYSANSDRPRASKGGIGLTAVKPSSLAMTPLNKTPNKGLNESSYDRNK